MPVVFAPAVRETSGVSTSAPGYLFNNYPYRTPARLNEYYNDFNTYAAGDWTVTTGGTGANALIDANGGQLTLTTDAATNDIQGIELTKKTFAFTTGSQVWFGCNLKIANATQSAIMFGLGNTFAALTPTDGVYFSKANASAVMGAVIRASSTSTAVTLNTSMSTVVAATFYSFGFWYNGVDTLKFYSTIGASANGANTPGNGSGYYSGGNQIAAAAGTGYTYALTNLPATSTNLTAGIAIKAGTTVAQVATIDWFLASEEIVGRY
jgi:hypothetical protein